AYVYDRDESRPLVEVQVVNRTGVAILDTGATHSIAGPMLYGLLVDAGVEFRKTSRTIGLADGSQQVCAALECDTDVTLEGHVIPTTFLVLPNAPTRTLLGRDFIMKALILLDLPQSSWCFNDEPRCWYPFITSFDLPTTGEMELMKVEASNLVLRDEEGAKLTADQRTELNALLRISNVLYEAREVHEKAQANQKRFADEGRRPAPDYSTGDLVLLKTQGSNDTTRGQTPKFIPRRDGPYRVKEAVSSTTYIFERMSNSETLEHEKEANIPVIFPLPDSDD
ncbi:Retrovirus-related Pol polyprotein from transposon 17.6, partial [Operophtera brumata]